MRIKISMKIGLALIALVFAGLVGCSPRMGPGLQATIPSPTPTTRSQLETTEPTIEPTKIESPQILPQPISFVGDGGERNRLSVMDTDGSMKLLADGLGTIFGYHWSLDGLNVLVSAYDGEYTGNQEFKLFLVNSDGSEYIRLFENYPIFDLVGTGWSPSGERIFILTSERLFIADIDSETISPILEPGNYYDVSWSPGGQHLLFVNYNPENTFHYYTINRVNIDGSGLTVLTEGYNEDPYPVWSPDGTSIAFRGDGGVFLMNADGSGLTHLFDGPSSISWSPDSRYISFLVFGATISSFDTKYSSLYPCIAEIDQPEIKTCYPVRDATYPTWSQDSRQIITVRWRVGNTGTPVETETYVIDINTGEVIQLYENMFFPQWVPIN